MKMMQKKLRSLIYAGLGLILCVLLCGGIGMTAQAAESKTYGDFTYEEGKDGITITKYIGEAKKVVIPDKINGTEVTSIGDGAFYNCNHLTSITIPEGVTSIGQEAFSFCIRLTDITIPEGVTSIGDEAFNACYSLTSISLPKSLKSIGNYGFRSTGLTSITIPENVRSIGGAAFDGCTYLKKVVLPEGITRIASKIFQNCTHLTSITIPDSVTSIGQAAFSGCTKLKSIVIPDSVIEINVIKKGENAVVYFGEGLCGLTTTIICNKDSFAYKYAKKYHISVKLMPKPVKKGTTLTVSSKKLKVRVTSSSKKNPTVTITKFTDKKAKKLTIPATVKVKGVTYKVTAVSDKAFKGNKKLTTVTIGSNVTKIGKEAFSGCKNLKKITVTAGKLKTISKNAFKGINKKATITVKGTKKAKTALKKQLKKKSIGYVKTWKIK